PGRRWRHEAGRRLAVEPRLPRGPVDPPLGARAVDGPRDRRRRGGHPHPVAAEAADRQRHRPQAPSSAPAGARSRALSGGARPPARRGLRAHHRDRRGGGRLAEDHRRAGGRAGQPRAAGSRAHARAGAAAHHPRDAPQRRARAAAGRRREGLRPPADEDRPAHLPLRDDGNADARGDVLDRAPARPGRPGDHPGPHRGGARLVLRGNLTVGVLTVFASYISNLLKPVEKINDLASAVSKGLAAGERLLALLEHAPEVRDVPAAVHIGRARGALELEDVHFAYPGSDGRGAAVLRGATLRLEPGSFTVLLGKSGAGKSTIVSLLLRLFDPSAGTVRLDGRPITGISLRSLRAQFAVMIQDTHLFAGTVREALTPPGAEMADERLWEALGRVGLDGFFRGLTAGLDTPLGEDGVDLSGGQRRRVALARAFLL